MVGPRIELLHPREIYSVGVPDLIEKEQALYRIGAGPRVALLVGSSSRNSTHEASRDVGWGIIMQKGSGCRRFCAQSKRCEFCQGCEKYANQPFRQGSHITCNRGMKFDSRVTKRLARA